MENVDNTSGVQVNARPGLRVERGAGGPRWRSRVVWSSCFGFGGPPFAEITKNPEGAPPGAEEKTVFLIKVKT